MPMQTTSYRAGGEHVDDPNASTVRDWDEFLGIDASAGGLDGLVHSLDYGFQDAAAAPLVHDHHLSSWRAVEQAALLAHGYVKTGHMLMPNEPFHQSRGGQSPYPVGIEQQQQLQFYRHQHQHQQQQHRGNTAQSSSSSKQVRQQKSHKRRAEFSHASPAQQQHFHVFTEATSSDAIEQAAICACVPPAKPAAAATATTTHVGRWTKKEHEQFLEGLKLYGRSWKKISTLVVTRTLVQIRTHAQKYLQKQSRAAQKLAATASGANDTTVRSASSCPSSSSSPDPQDTSPAVDSACNRTAHSTIDPNLVLSTPTAQTSDVAFAGWRLSPPREQTFLPVAFPASMSSSAPSVAVLASPHTMTLSCSSSASPSSLTPLPSSSSGANLVSSFKLDQLLQDESSGTCDDGEYYASPRDAMHGSALRSEHKLAQRILAPVTATTQESSKMLDKPSQQRNSGFPHVLTGHELLHTFDHEYAGSLLVSPSLPSPAIASAPRIDEYGSYCDWM